MEHQKCPICGERLVKGKDALISHIDKVHATDIPPKMSGGEYAYLVTHNNKPRKCMMCSNSTEWNLGTNKYNAFCSEACKAAYVKLARARLKKVYGKENLLDDPDQQKKMLANRSISGIYHHTDGGKITYTGSYEEDFVRMLDTFLSVPSKDIIMPSPHVYEYMYKGEKKFYFPDAFIPSLNLEVEIKDGGTNPNMHHKIQDVDKVKERSKDEVLCKQNIYHYIKVEDKNYKSFFALITKLVNNDITHMEEKRKIKVVPEGGRGAVSVMERIETNILMAETHLNDLAVAEGFNIEEDIDLDVAMEAANELIEKSEDKETVDKIAKLEEEISAAFDSEDQVVLERLVVVHEGLVQTIWSAVKAAAKKVVEVLIMLWKAIVNFIKAIFEKVKSFFMGAKNAAKNFVQPVEVKFISLESARITSDKFKNKADIMKAAMDAIDSMAEEVRNRSDIQTDCTQKLQQYLEKEDRQAAREGFIPVDEAKVMYSGDIDMRDESQPGAGDSTKYSQVGKDVNDTKDIIDPTRFDRKMVSMMLKSEDIVKEYNAYIDHAYETIMRSTPSDKDDTITLNMRQMSQCIIQASSMPEYKEIADRITGGDVDRYLKGIFFQISDNPTVIRRLLSLRLNYNKKITSLMKKMIKTNWQVIGFSEEEADKLAEDVSKNDATAVKSVYARIVADIKNLIKRPGWLSFKKYGGGDVFYYPADDPLISSSVTDGRVLYTMSLRWDCIIHTHGGNSRRVSEDVRDEWEDTGKKLEEAEKRAEEVKTKHRELHDKKRDFHRKEGYGADIDPELQKQIDDIDKEFDKAILDKDNLRHKYLELGKTGEEVWSCLPMQIGNGPKRMEINLLIQDAIDAGYKKIYVYACNPGHLKLDKEILERKGVVVHVAHNSMIGAVSSSVYQAKDPESREKAALANVGIESYHPLFESLGRPTKHNLQEIMRCAIGNCNSALMDMSESDRKKYAKGHIFKNESRSDALKFANGEEVFVIKWDSTPYIKGMGGTSHQVLDSAKRSVETFHGKSVSLRVAKVEGQDVLFATKNMNYKGDE